MKPSIAPEGSTRRILLVNGYVHTPLDPGATALLIEGETIGWIGHEGAALAHADGVDQVIDVEGALIAPAFVDAHVHVTPTGIGLSALDLSTAKSERDILAMVATFASDLSPGSVLLGHGWDDSEWSDRELPTRAQLEHTIPGVAAYLTRIDLHSAIASTAALDLAARKAGPSGINGLPGYSDTGLLNSQAHHFVRAAVLDSISSDQRAKFFDAALSTWAAQGVAAVHEMSGPDISTAHDLQALLTHSRRQSGPEVYAYWGELGGAERAKELGAVGAGGDLFADGSLGSHTARLSYPYVDSGTRGVAHVTAAEVRDHVLECVAVGIQAGFHTIGDAAIGEVLEGFDAAAQVVGQDRIRLGRHRMEHIEMPTRAHIPEISRLGITASVQPMFEELWAGEGGMYEQRLGQQRTSSMNPWSLFAGAGIPLAFGSDSPVTGIGPWRAIRAAMNHRTSGSAISARAAFAAHTRGGWRAIGMDDGGVLRPGAAATIAIWDCDEMAVQETDNRVSRWSTDPRAGTPMLPLLSPDIDLPRCLLTIRDGQVIYDGLNL
jgi:predicted amidohydrolase YtcJ